MVKGIIPCFSLLFTASLFNQSLAQGVTGKVFKDFNANGIFDNTASYKEVGQSGVNVKAFNASNVEVGSAITAQDGTYAIASVSNVLRIEFSSFPNASFSGPKGTGSNTSVQFVTAPATNVNFGINDPDNYWDSSTDPRYVVPCYVANSSSGTASSDPAIVSTPYSSKGLNANYSNENSVKGTGPVPQMDALISQVGTVWGEAYYKAQKHMYFSSFLKRHCGLADGAGFIYNIDYTNPQAPSFTGKFNLQGVTPKNGGANIDLGSVTRTGGADYELPSDKLSPSIDLDAFGKVGAMAFGDIDMQPSSGNLWAVNCFQKALIKIDVSNNPTSTPTNVNQYLLSSITGYPTSTTGILRPWALKFHGGFGYLGLVSDASLSKNDADLLAYVLKFDPNNISSGFTAVLSFNPNVKRSDLSAKVQFHSWLNSYSEPPIDGSTRIIYAQPVLSDIEIDENENMYVSFFDRSGHQIGVNNYKPISGTTSFEDVFGVGEILKACPNSTGWNIEGTSGCGGTSEFIQDIAGDAQVESSEGAVALLKGKNQLLQISVDPHAQGDVGQTYWSTQGANTYNLTTGEIDNWYSVYYSNNNSLFGKANGLGDVEFITGIQPIEVGNRLWNDTNKNGIQDAGEPVLTGVKVQLFKNGLQVGIDIITNAVTGEYYFSGLTPNSLDYEIRVPNVNGTNKQTQLAGLMPTTANAGTNDEIDSDATVSGTNTYASIPFNTGNAGENNHTLDFGFKCIIPTAKPGGLDVTVCDGSSTFDLPDAKIGTDAETWTVVSSAPTATALIDATSGVVNGMSIAGVYVFKLTNNATGCFENVSITVAPMIAGGADKTICSPTSISTLNAPSNSQTWTVFTNQTGTNPVVAANGNVTGLTVDGVYTFRLTEGTCYDEVQITRIAPPNAGADISTCTTTAKLVVAVSGTQTWSPVLGNPSPATIDASGNVSGMVSNGDYQFELKSIATGCSDIVKVTKTTGVDVSAESMSVCTDGIIVLKASSTVTSGVSYFWNGPSSFTSNQQTTTIANASKSNEGVYTVTATLIGGCSATATANILFKEITVGIIGGFTNVCVGQNLVLEDKALRKDTDPKVMTYFWSGPNGTNRYTSSVAKIIIPTDPDMSQVGEYMLVETFDNGCTVTNNLTVTVTKCQKLGNLVWNDANNDGLNNNGELGIPNVPVKIYDVLKPTVVLATTTTGADGKYIFKDLYPGSFVVEIESPTGFKSSTGTNGSATGAYEPAPDPNTPDTNDNDDGTKTTGQFIRSLPVDLGNLSEPVNDGDVTVGTAEDKNSNLTIDFGIFKPAQLGDFVWSDTNKNGIQDAGELGVSGVKVNLFAETGTTPIATTTTGSDGKYLFDNLIAGNYTVEFDKTSIGTGNGFSPKNTTTTTVDKDSDADVSNGKSSQVTLTAGEFNQTIDAGIIGNCVPSAIGTISVPSLCVGQSLTMTATSSDPSATYAWSTNATTAFTSTSKDVTLPSLKTGNSGTYTVLITNSNLCTSALTANVVVNPIPTITVNSASFCAGATGTLTATGGTTYAWTGPGTFTTATAILSVTQQGVYTVTGNSNECTAVATTSVTVYPKTVLTATGAAICLGGSGTISVLPAGLKYVWTGPAAFSGSTTQTPSIANATDADKGTYTVTVTDGNTCIATAAVAVTVGTALTVTPSSNSPVCVGTRLDLTITGGTGATYLWTSPKGVTTSVQNPFTQSATIDDKGVWTVAVKNEDGCKGSGSVNIDVKPALTGVTATASVPGCTGDNITLTSSPAGAKSYEWSGTPSFASSVQNPTIVKPTVDNYTFTVKVTNADGCTALATASTAIYTAPAATATANSPVCFGNTINLGVITSGTKFAWTSPDGFTYSTQNPSIANATSAKDGTYTVVVTNANSCNATATVKVVVNSQLNGGNDLSICAPITTAQLTVISGATWSADATNPAAATVDANGKVSGMTVNGTYAFTITDLGNCKDIVKVFRNEKLDAGDNVIICSPISTAKLLKLNTGQTWKYFANGQTQPTPTIDANGNVAGVTQDGSYLFILEQTGGSTYCADTVAVIRKPSPMAGGDQTVKSGGGICEPLKTAKLQAAASGQKWSVASNSVGFGTVAIDANGTITNMETNGIYTFVLTQGECKDSVQVERIAKPVAGLDVEICSDIKTVKLPNAPANMTWLSIASNPVGTLINATSGEVTGLTTAIEYKFILKNAGGCTDTVSVKTKAIPTFDVNAVQATCSIGAANPDAQLIISSTDANAKYDYNEGITYTGTKTFATAIAITIPVTGLINPTTDKSYAVRVFNSTGCYTDKIVILKTRVCECKADVCVPYSFKKTK